MVKGTIYGLMEINKDENKQVLSHKTIYDFKTLKNLLESAGFGNVRRYDWQSTIHKDYPDHSMAYIPSNDYQRGILVSLNIEADKVNSLQSSLLQAKTEIKQFAKRVVNKIKREYHQLTNN